MNPCALQIQSFATYLRHFDYAERQAMKIGVAEALDLYATDKAQLVDIRFAEEYAAWHLGFGLHIPLDALPDRLHELDRSKRSSSPSARMTTGPKSRACFSCWKAFSRAISMRACSGWSMPCAATRRAT